MDIRLYTVLIIRKENQYLVGSILGSKDLRWSDSPYDAWRTRIRANARSVAEKTGGEICLFNPAVQQLRRMEKER